MEPHMPRLHPEDLKQMSKNVANELRPHVEEMLSKEQLINSLITLSVQDVAKILNKDPQTISNYCRDKLIKAAKSGKEWVITQESLNTYINGSQE